MERKLPPKPQRQDLTEDQAARFISGAPDERPAVPAPAAAAPAAAAGQADPAVPRKLRKRKEPVTMTLDPVILADFDEVASEMGLSRAAATGMAMRDFVDAWRAKRASRG